MPEHAKLEAGGQEQFTLVTSAGLDDLPLFRIIDKTGTAVYSSAAAMSASGNYYEWAAIPSSRGHFTYEWQYTISAHTMIQRGTIEIVETTTVDSTGLYCAESEVFDLHHPLRDSEIRHHEMTQFIRSIMAEIDGKLAGRYAVPFATGASSLPPLISTICQNLTLVTAMERRPGAAGISEWVMERNTRYRDMLDELADGTMTLTTSGGDVIAPTLPGIMQAHHSHEDYAPTFNLLDPETQRIDPDLLDDTEDAL